MSPRKHSRSEKFRSLYLWHRYAGLVGALLVAWLATTGLLLNHSDHLDLANRHVSQEWLLSLYGIAPPSQIEGLSVDGHWLAQGGDRAYLDGHLIGTGNIVGAASTAFGVVVAFPGHLQLHLDDGELVEALPFTTTPAPLSNVIVTNEGVVLVAGDDGFLANEDFTTFTPTRIPDVRGTEFLPLPEDLAQTVRVDVLHHSLTWERVLLDLHAGRMFSGAGVWLADIAALLLLLLAVTGVIVWVQRTTRNRR